MLLADTITKLGPGAAGAVIVSGSHGGVYTAYLARRGGARAVILNDAGVGKDRAGIACLDYGERYGMAAATVDYRSARIGDTDDMIARGVISHVNALAAAVGCVPGMRCADAAARLADAPLSEQMPAPHAEARAALDDRAVCGPRRVWLLDSVSLVEPDDADQIVVTGSHGGLVGGRAEMALRVDAFAALYNDAGVGIDRAGLGRLAALDRRGIAAATVAAASARIGDARSSFADGVLSAVNRSAAAFAAPGDGAREFIARLQQRSR